MAECRSIRSSHEPPPAAREGVLDAFEAILIADGERAATLDATARAAGVSKGGLLYHFALEGRAHRGPRRAPRRLVDEDVARHRPGARGPIAYFVRSSVDGRRPARPRFVATRPARAGRRRERRTRHRSARERWLDAIGRHVADPTVALAITLIGDGLYYDSALHGDDDDSASTCPGAAEMDALVALLERIATVPTARLLG